MNFDFKNSIDKLRKSKLFSVLLYIFAILGVLFVIFMVYKFPIETKPSTISSDSDINIIENDYIDDKVENNIQYENNEIDNKGNVINKYMPFNDNVDFNILKKEINGHNLVYSPISIKRNCEVLNELTVGDTKEQLFKVGSTGGLSFSNDNNKKLESAIFIKNLNQDISYEDIQELYKYSDYPLSVYIENELQPKIVNDWACEASNGQIDSLYDEGDDFSDKNIIISSLAMIDMNWKNNITSNMSLFSQHENFSCQSYNFTYMGYTPLFFNEKLKVSSLEFAVAANKYDIVAELGYDNIKNTVLEEYTKWYEDHKESYLGKPEEYIEYYMKEISSNYGQYSTSTDFKYYVDDEIISFCKELKQYDNLELEYIGIMPKNEKLDQYVNKLNGEYLNDLLSKFKGTSYNDFLEGYCTRIKGYLPVFDYESFLDLTNDLKSFGVNDVFDIDKAQFSDIITFPLYISGLNNKTNISFSNEGIKAISFATCDGLGAGSPDFDYVFDVPIIDIDLTFNKPFVYFIREKSSNQIFFVGTVYEPMEYVE